MRRESRNGVTVDVCRICEAVWLDHHEVMSLWTAAGTAAALHGRSNFALDGDAASLLDVLWHAPDLAVSAIRGAAHVADAGVEVVAQAPSLLSAVPDVLSGLLDVAGDVAGAVFGIIAEVIGGIFSGF